MAEINIAGTLYPDVANEATHDESYGRGGYRTVGTYAERDNIPLDHKVDGTLVFTRDQNATTWRWNDSNSVWDLFPSSIQTGQISNNAISEAKLNTSSVSPRTLQSDAVTTTKLDNGAVTLAKLDSSVTDNYYNKSTSDNIFMASFTTPPASNDDVGVTGTMAVDSTYLYVCIVGSTVAGTTGVWGRTPLNTTW